MYLDWILRIKTWEIRAARMVVLFVDETTQWVTIYTDYNVDGVWHR